jgi:hypothetical protein
VRLVVGESRLSLIELSLKSAWIDLREQVALLDGLAFLEVDARDQARDLAADGRGVESGHGAKAGQHDRHIAPLNRCRDDRNWLWRIGCWGNMTPTKSDMGGARRHKHNGGDADCEDASGRSWTCSRFLAR